MRVRLLLAAVMALLGLAGCASDDVPLTSKPEPRVVEAAAFFADPASLAGERVTVRAQVDSVLNPDAFTLTSAPNPAGFLVVHTQRADVSVRETLEVTGTVIASFTPPTVQPFTDTFAQDPEFRRYVGRAYLDADKINQQPGEDR